MNSGIYFLLLRLPRACTLTIRRREYRLARGFYVYTGSAQRNLAQRVARHRRAEKKRHWHIDALLEHAGVAAVRVLPGATRADEVRCAEEWAHTAEFIPIPKFGASDSPARTHLVGFRTRRAVMRHPLWQRACDAGL